MNNTPRLTTRLPAWALLGLLVIGGVLLVREAQTFLMPIVFAVALTFALVSPVQRLNRLGVPEPCAAGVVLVMLLLVLGLLSSMLVEPANNWIRKAPTTVQQVVEQLDRVRAAIPVIAPPRKARSDVSGPDPVKDKIASEGVTLTGRVLSQILSVGYLTLATFILLYFLLASERWLLDRTVEALPDKRARARLLGGLRRAQRDIALYLGTMALINIGLGTATALAMMSLGLPNPILWGTVAAVLNFIPYFGPFLITVMLLMAGVIGFPDRGLMVVAPAAAFLALHGLESNFISPIVVGRRLALSPLSVFLSVLFWGWLWGMAGAMLAVPILLMVRIACRRHPRGKLLCVYLEGRPSTGTRPWRP